MGKMQKPPPTFSLGPLHQRRKNQNMGDPFGPAQPEITLQINLHLTPPAPRKVQCHPRCHWVPAPRGYLAHQLHFFLLLLLGCSGFFSSASSRFFASGFFFGFFTASLLGFLVLLAPCGLWLLWFVVVVVAVVVLLTQARHPSVPLGHPNPRSLPIFKPPLSVQCILPHPVLGQHNLRLQPLFFQAI